MIANPAITICALLWRSPASEGALSLAAGRVNSNSVISSEANRQTAAAITAIGSSFVRRPISGGRGHRLGHVPAPWTLRLPRALGALRPVRRPAGLRARLGCGRRLASRRAAAAPLWNRVGPVGAAAAPGAGRR